jgi:hypothetical protein
MGDAKLRPLVPSVVEGCYEVSYHTLHQLLILTRCTHVVAAQYASVVVHHNAGGLLCLPTAFAE